MRNPRSLKFRARHLRCFQALPGHPATSWVASSSRTCLWRKEANGGLIIAIVKRFLSQIEKLRCKATCTVYHRLHKHKLMPAVPGFKKCTVKTLKIGNPNHASTRLNVFPLDHLTAVAVSDSLRKLAGSTLA